MASTEIVPPRLLLTKAVNPFGVKEMMRDPAPDGIDDNTVRVAASMTETLPACVGMNTCWPLGLNATPSGLRPTGNVIITALVAASMIETMLSPVRLT